MNTNRDALIDQLLQRPKFRWHAGPNDNNVLSERIAHGIVVDAIELEALRTPPPSGDGLPTPAAYCAPDNPFNTSAFSWPGSDRRAAHTMALYTADQVQALLQSAQVGGGDELVSALDNVLRLKNEADDNLESESIGATGNDAAYAALQLCLDHAALLRRLAQPQREVAAVAGWVNEDELPENYPYDAMFPHSKVDGVRMFPVFVPAQQPASAAAWDVVSETEANNGASIGVAPPSHNSGTAFPDAREVSPVRQDEPAGSSYKYRVMTTNGGFEPQIFSCSGIGNAAWFPLNEDGYWLCPDDFSDGEITKHISMSLDSATKSIIRAQSINMDNINSVNKITPNQQADKAGGEG